MLLSSSGFTQQQQKEVFLPSIMSSGLLRFSYTTMITTRIIISASTPRKGQSGARWLRTRSMVV